MDKLLADMSAIKQALLLGITAWIIGSCDRIVAAVSGLLIKKGILQKPVIVAVKCTKPEKVHSR